MNAFSSGEYYASIDDDNVEDAVIQLHLNNNSDQFALGESIAKRDYKDYLMAAGVSEQKAEFLADAAAAGVLGLTGRPKTTKTGSTSQASDTPEQTTKTENGSAETAQSTKTKVADGAGNGQNGSLEAPDRKLVSLDDLPIEVTREIPAWNGSGPSKGILGVNPSSTSIGGLENFTNSEGVEFIFDPSTSTFLVRGQKFNAKHEVLANTIDAPMDQVVGGILTRSEEGPFITNESSGHYWQNWTPELRESFVETMKQYGLDVNHSEGM